MGRRSPDEEAQSYVSRFPSPYCTALPRRLALGDTCVSQLTAQLDALSRQRLRRRGRHVQVQPRRNGECEKEDDEH